MASRLTTTLRTLAKFANVPVGTTTVDTAAALLNSSALKLPDMDYDYGALEPTIIGEIMELHHSKHHNTYVTNLKVSLEKYVDAKKAHDTAAIEAAESGIVFNGGGHYNHSLFWKMLAPPSLGGGEPPSGDLAAAIARDFGSFESFKERFNTTTAPVQGSGWGWLGYEKSSGKLKIVTRPNQDCPETADVVPLLGVDVWEHAYYLQYKNLRPEYLKHIWEVVNFKDVAARYHAAQA